MSAFFCGDLPQTGHCSHERSATAGPDVRRPAGEHCPFLTRSIGRPENTTPDIGSQQNRIIEPDARPVHRSVIHSTLAHTRCVQTQDEKGGLGWLPEDGQRQTRANLPISTGVCSLAQSTG
jgi:hypothetical protein